MNKQDALRLLPGVDKLIGSPELMPLIEQYGRSIVTNIIRMVLEQIRGDILNGKQPPDNIINEIIKFIRLSQSPSLYPVINATGIILHTNLGRAPLGHELISELTNTCTAYTNLEFDTASCRRGERNVHAEELLRILTRTESATIVNNNAASLLLVLNALAKDREVIISRGELIEIGGSFRLPEIMAAAGAVMVEVGTTNRTRIADYENAITENTGLILKVHKSNFYTRGFTEEASIKELAKLAHKNNIPMIYDLGSGLPDKIQGLDLNDEPTTKSALDAGADIVMFSCDKILSGPQAGAIVGKKELLDIIKKSPLRRTLRVGKLTLAALSYTLRQWMSPEKIRKIPSIAMMLQTDEELRQKAEELQATLSANNINSTIVKSTGQYGGGSMPHLELKSYAVQIDFAVSGRKQKEEKAEEMFAALARNSPSILGILRKGNLLFDVLTLNRQDFSVIAERISSYIKS